MVDDAASAAANGPGKANDDVDPTHALPRPRLIIPTTGSAALLLVMHNFEARSPDELTLRKGEHVELLEKDDDFGDGWYLGRCLSTNQQGLFPQVYTSPTIVNRTVVESSPNFIAPSQPSSSGAEPRSGTGAVPSPTPAAAGPAVLMNPRTPTDTAPPILETPYLSPVNSHISSSNSTVEEPHDHKPTPPLAVEKVSSTATTPKIPSSSKPPKATAPVKDDRATSYPAGIRSPVVEDTLSDIDEAITEISNSRHSRPTRVIKDHNRRHSSVSDIRPPLPPTTEQLDDSASEYSKQDNESGSDIEDEEAEGSHLIHQGGPATAEVSYTEAEVKMWTPTEVSKYLQSRLVPLSSCQKFEEQEVSGSILLQLEMSHLKELELGSFGKRFEVWKEIEHLVKRAKPPPLVKTKPRSGSDARLSAVGKTQDTSPRQRSNTVGGAPVLPTIPSQHIRFLSKQQHHINTHEANRLNPKLGSYPSLHTPSTATTIASSTGGLVTPRTPPGIFEAPRSPPMSPLRSGGLAGHGPTGSARRLSSHELSPTALNVALSTSAAILAAGADIGAHRRDPSFDRNWSSSILIGKRPSTGSDGAVEYGHGHNTSASIGTRDTGDSGFSGSQPQTPLATESSYFSNGDSIPKERRVLQKGGGNYAGKASYIEEQRLRSATAHSKQSRVGGAETTRKPSPVMTAAQAYHVRGNSKDKQNKRKSASFSGPPEGFPYDSPGIASPSSTKITIPVRRTTDEPVIPHSGLTPTRSISETPRQRDSYVGSGEGSTPSLTATIESDPVGGTPERPPKSDRTQSTSGRRVRGVSSGPALRQKSKKQNTSAWEKGLREITPQEAAEQADFSGWMKKRGSNGIGVWKPRFFVLQGRRLSYFYADTDMKERGLIDITSHRVLPATDDRLVSLHAQFSAATSPSTTPHPPSAPSPTFQSLVSLNGERSPTSPPPAASERKEKGGEKEKGKEEKERGWFTFKLVPPAPGALKGVTFTPPKLHYFATDTREEGKKWMGAIMKATIDRDESKPVVSSYNAKTISLAKARQLRARPPELASGEEAGSGFHTPESSTSGLAISGVEFGDGDGEEADVEDGQDDSLEISRNGEAGSSHNGDGGDGGDGEDGRNGGGGGCGRDGGDGGDGGEVEAARNGDAVAEEVGEDDDEKDPKELMALVSNLGITTQ